MKLLWKQVLRNIRATLGQFLSIAAVMLLGSFFFAGMNEATRALSSSVDRYYAETNIADVTGTFVYADDETVARIAAQTGGVAEGRTVTRTQGKFGESSADVMLYTLTEQVDLPLVVAGELPQDAGSCIVDRTFAEANGVRVGDTVELDSGAFTVSGLYISSENVYKVDTGAPTSKSDEFALVTVLKQAHAPYNQIVVRGVRGDPDEIFGNETEYIAALSFARADGISEKTFRSAHRQIANLAAVVPTLFLLVAVVIVVISTARTVASDRTQIAVMQALGRSKGAICAVYVLYAVAAALLGTAIGGVTGVLVLPKVYAAIFGTQFVLPKVTASFGIYFPLSVCIGCLIAAASAGTACVRALSVVPAEGMRPKKQAAGKRTVLERFKWFSRLKFGNKLFVRNVTRNKLRILLSSVGVVGSVMLLMLGLGLYDRIGAAQRAYRNSIGYDYCVTLEGGNSLDEAGERFGGDAAVFGSAAVVFDGKTSDALQATALPDGCETVRLTDRRGARLPIAEDGVILPHGVADELGIAVGDTVTLVGAMGEKTVTVGGIAVQYLAPTVYMSHDAAAGLMPKTASAVYVRGGARETLMAIAGARRVFDKEEMCLRVIDTAGILEVAVVIFVLGAGVLGLTVVYNVTAVNIGERIREIATLKVLGLTDGETTRLLLKENLVMTTVGALLGLPLGWGMLRWAAQIVSGFNMSIPYDLTFPVAFGAILLAFVFGIAATLLCIRKALKVDLGEALKGNE